MVQLSTPAVLSVLAAVVAAGSVFPTSSPSPYLTTPAETYPVDTYPATYPVETTPVDTATYPASTYPAEETTPVDTATYPAETSTYPEETSTEDCEESTTPVDTATTYPTYPATTPEETSTYPATTPEEETTTPCETSTYPEETSTYPVNTYPVESSTTEATYPVESSTEATYPVASSTPEETYPVATYPAGSTSTSTVYLTSTETAVVYHSKPEASQYVTCPAVTVTVTEGYEATTPVASYEATTPVASYETTPVASTYPATTPEEETTTPCETSTYPEETSTYPAEHKTHEKPTTYPASTPTYPAGSGYKGAKRGIAYASVSTIQLPQQTHIGWAHNWAATDSGTPEGVEYVPALKTIDMVSEFQEAAKTCKSEYLLYINEADMTVGGGGSPMTPGECASNYKQYMMPYAGTKKLCAPSVTSSSGGSLNGLGSASGLEYLQQFAEACKGCQVDCVPLHWYGLAGQSGAQQAEDFKNYVQKASEVVKGLWPNAEMWFDEFGASPHIDQAPQVNKDFIDSVVPYLDQCESVSRYSYFAHVPGQMVNADGSLTSIGEHYLTL